MKQINGRALELRGLLLENRVRTEIAAAGTLVRCAARQRVLIGRREHDFKLLCASMRGVAAESGRSWVSKRALLESQLPALQNGKRVLSEAAAELLGLNSAIETAAGKIAALDGLRKRIAGLTRQQEIARLTRADFLNGEELAEIKGAVSSLRRGMIEAACRTEFQDDCLPQCLAPGINPAIGPEPFCAVQPGTKESSKSTDEAAGERGSPAEFSLSASRRGGSRGQGRDGARNSAGAADEAEAGSAGAGGSMAVAYRTSSGDQISIAVKGGGSALEAKIGAPGNPELRRSLENWRPEILAGLRAGGLPLSRLTVSRSGSGAL